MRDPGTAQDALGFATGPALVPEFDRQPGLVFQFAGKLACVCALPACFAAHMDRVAHHNQGDTFFDCEASQHLDIVAPALAGHCLQPLCGNPKLVAQGEADSLSAEIDSENAADGAHDSIVFAHASLRDRRFPVVIRTSSQSSPRLIEEGVRSYALPVIAAGVLIAILYLGRVFFITAIFAVIVALILEPFVGLLARARVPRPVGTFIVGSIALLVLYFGGLAAYNQLSGLVGDAPEFQERLGALIASISDKIQDVEDRTAHMLVPIRKPAEPVPPVPDAARPQKRGRKSEIRQSPAPAPAAPGSIPEVRIHDDRNPIGDYVYDRLGTVYEFILMASFVPFLVYFMLSWRDHVYRSFLRFFEGSDRMAAARSMEGVAEMARAFVVGNFMIGVLLAILSWIAFGIIHIPYPFLVGSLSGALSLMPYIGLPLALVPPILAALAGGAPSSVGLFAFIIVLVLHLTAMNVLYPKIVGARVHLNPLVVTFSLMFWGFLWGAAGLLLAIPITAGIKAVCDNVADLRSWGRFLGD